MRLPNASSTHDMAPPSAFAFFLLSIISTVMTAVGTRKNTCATRKMYTTCVIGSICSAFSIPNGPADTAMKRVAAKSILSI